MKLTFEGQSIQDILEDIAAVISAVRNPNVPSPREVKAMVAEAAPVLQATAQEANALVDKPVGEIPGNSGKSPTATKTRTPKQLENDERLRAAAKAKQAAARGANDKKTAKPAAPEGEQQQEPFSDPADIVRLRERTLDDLQAAYANGHQQEVFELLSRFGDGAKSFRELKPEAFLPIREAIDSGALS